MSDMKTAEAWTQHWYIEGGPVEGLIPQIQADAHAAGVASVDKLAIATRVQNRCVKIAEDLHKFIESPPAGSELVLNGITVVKNAIEAADPAELLGGE